jgi:hypothetical protein
MPKDLRSVLQSIYLNKLHYAFLPPPPYIAARATAAAAPPMRHWACPVIMGTPPVLTLELDDGLPI